MLEIIDIIGFIVKKFMQLIEKIQYYKSPTQYIQKNIMRLHEAIKDKNEQSAHYYFVILANHFKIKYKSKEIFPESLSGMDVEEERLIEKYREILHAYKNLPSSDRSMPFEEIERIEKDLTEELRKSCEDDGADCIECGAKIPVKENKCPKCGWSWNS